jgi:hypothetical protein
MGVLFVDPALPPWLPEVIVRRLRVGDGAVSLRFVRRPDGHTTCEVLEKSGLRHVVRRRGAWRATHGGGSHVEERIEAALTSEAVRARRR